MTKTNLKVGDTGIVFDKMTAARYPARVVDVNLVGNSIHNTALVVNVNGVENFLKMSQDGEWSSPNGFVWEEKPVENPKYFTYVKHNGFAAKFQKLIGTWINNPVEFAGVIVAESSDGGKTFFNHEFVPFGKEEEEVEETETPPAITPLKAVTQEDVDKFLAALFKGVVK